MNHNWKKPVRKPRSRADMLAYLKEHPRYHTMNSWNNATSYARSIKIHYFDYPSKAAEATAWDLIDPDIDVWAVTGVKEIFDAFDRSYNHSWQIGQNGRSGGYVVLYQGGVRTDGYKRYCTMCGQGNCKADAEKCGRCGSEDMIDYPFVQTYAYAGKGLDEDEYFEDWDTDSLRDRVDLIWDFDKTVDQAIKQFIAFCKANVVEDQEITVRKTIKVTACRS